MTKEQMKKNIEQHANNCNAAGGKFKGYRKSAWCEVKAFEILVNAAKDK